MLSQPSLPVAGQILLGTLAIAAAICDIRFRRIPNWLVLAGILAGFAWNVFSSGWSGLGSAAEGLGVGFVLYFPLYLLRARGAGDVKLLAATGSIAGPLNCFWIFLITAILGGVIALILVAARGRLHQTFSNMARMLYDLIHLRAPYRTSENFDVTTNRGMRLPHAALIAVGIAAFFVLVW